MPSRSLDRLALAWLLAAALAPLARAQCGTSYVFSQWDYWREVYTYVYVPAGANEAFDPSPESPSGGVVGRLWQPGARASANDNGAACPARSWLIRCPSEWGCDEGAFGYVNGALTGQVNGPVPCLQTGCPTGAMILLVETASIAGDRSYFAIADSAATYPEPLVFNYSNANWYLTEIPAPELTITRIVGSTLTMSLVFRDVGAGYFGSNGPATRAITGFVLMEATGEDEPGRVASDWTPVARIPYDGGDATLEGFRVDCSEVPEGHRVYLSTRIEFDGGELLGDYVGAPAIVDCAARPALPKIDRPQRNRPATIGVRPESR